MKYWLIIGLDVCLQEDMRLVYFSAELWLKTRMTTFIVHDNRWSDIGLLLSRESFEESTISDLESPSNFEVKEKNIEIGQETTKLCFNYRNNPWKFEFDRSILTCRN